MDKLNILLCGDLRDYVLYELSLEAETTLATEIYLYKHQWFINEGNFKHNYENLLFNETNPNIKYG